MCSSKLCNFLAAILSVFIGIAVSVLFLFGIIVNFILATKIALILATALLLMAIAVIAYAALSKTPALLKCLCAMGVFLVFSILASITTSIAILSIGLGISLLCDLLLAFLGGLFFSLMIFLLGAFLSCVIKRLCQKC